MNTTEQFSALTITEANERPSLQVRQQTIDAWPAGDVTIEVHYSSLNYKDAMACQGHKGIIRSIPHVPGIDATGVVLHSDSPEFRTGEEVVVTGYDLGQGSFGAWSERIRVPAEWVVQRPETLSALDSMSLGTAGFTAAQCVVALERNGVEPGGGPILVTGATGGVGCLATAMLAKLGFEVVAVTGKSERSDWLIQIGASEVVPRDEILGDPKRPILSARWAGGVDTVGGDILTSIVKSTRYGGAVTTCGLVAGSDLEMTLYPFLLRGVSLCGIASADCPMDARLEIWQRLATDLKPDNLDIISRVIRFEEMQSEVEKILDGQIVGRVVLATTADMADKI
ncbi:MAG TPA: oxidoreductase [Planctomycetaceae bacterium]|nr:oxidoreductase [Planctomycetaceae bacterium]